MLSETGQFMVLGFLALLGSAAFILSILLLRRGKLYRRLSPKARPRRWVLISLVVLFAIFAVWFPVWFFWPDLLITRILTGLFLITFVAVGFALRAFSGWIDRLVIRKGWQLR
jgi:hypothetical protein